MKFEKGTTTIALTIFWLVIFMTPILTLAQENEHPEKDRQSLLSAAKEIMVETRYCALITLDKSGQPQARTMDPFPPDENFIVWFGTNSNSRKVEEIKVNSKATLYYQAPDARGYVVLKGNAYIVDDPQQKSTYWKKEWDRFYPQNKENFILIKFVPSRLEIVDYKHGIASQSKTWNAPSVEFPSP